MTTQQAKAAQEILDALRNSGQELLLIILQGVSGIGKSVVLKNIANQIEELGGIAVLDIRDIIWREKYKNSNSSLVIPATPCEWEQLQSAITKHYQKWNKLVVVWLRAMDEEDTSVFADQYQQGNPVSLKADLKFGLGIPLLVKQIIDLNPSTEEAVIMAAEHMRHYFGILSSPAVTQAEAMQFLGRELPLEVVSFLENTAPSRISDRLYEMIPRALEQIAIARSCRQNFQHVSPFFVAPESEEMYNRMLGGRDGFPFVQIYIPEIPKNDYDDFVLAFDERSIYPNRPTVCGGSYRKFGILFHNPYGHTYANQSECHTIEEDAAKFREDFRCCRFPLRRSKGIGRLASVFVDTHQHREIRIGPTFNAWAVESWCQQKGIGYIVKNWLIDAKYAYLPETQHIIMIGKLNM